MPTLTTSWQSLGSATLYSGTTIHLDGKYSSQSTANNTSQVQFRLRSVGTSWRTTSGTASFSGAFTDSKSCATYPNYINSGDTIYEISKPIPHNTDGTKSLSIGGSVWAYINSAKRTGTISNKSVTIPTINRLATITSAPDFNDEENPTITFSNPAGFTVKPYINFYDNNNNVVYRLSRDISAVSPYTWNITSAERTAMRNAMTSQPTYRAQVGVDTYSGSTALGYNSVAKTISFVNANPTQTITTTETNQKIVTLLGESTANTIIQNASNLTFSVAPTALKGATISKVELNGIVDTTSPYEFTNIVPTTNTFTVKTTDSRTLSVENIITKQMVSYNSVDITTVLFKRYAQTSADVILNAEIRYTQATFGTTPNVPTIKWKKGEDGTWNTIPSTDYTIDTQNNKIIITNLTLSNAIPYNQNAAFTLYVEDLLTTDSDGNEVIRGIATCEAGEHDFQVNGDLYVADTNRENAFKINDLIPVTLYTNSSGTNGNITLSESADNFSRIVFYFKNDIDVYGSTEIDEPDGKTISLYIALNNSSVNWVQTSKKEINGTSVTHISAYETKLMASSTTTSSVNCIYVTKIVGYR